MVDETAGTIARPDAESAEWLQALAGTGRLREAALARLHADWRDLLAALWSAVDSELTPREREVFIAIVVNQVPLDALVTELASSRNAIYTMVFDPGVSYGPPSPQTASSGAETPGCA